jgi:hypothetical protein
VQSHSDARNFILTAHLGLQVPTEPPGACWMRVADERRGWEENKVVVIDTTFEHETGVSARAFERVYGGVWDGRGGSSVPVDIWSNPDKSQSTGSTDGLHNHPSPADTHTHQNASAEDRYVLIIDFFHPELTGEEREALKCVYDIRNQFEGRATGPYSPAAASAPSPLPPSSQPSFFDSVKNMFTGGK